MLNYAELVVELEVFPKDFEDTVKPFPNLDPARGYKPTPFRSKQRMSRASFRSRSRSLATSAVTIQHKPKHPLMGKKHGEFMNIQHVYLGTSKWPTHNMYIYVYIYIHHKI